MNRPAVSVVIPTYGHRDWVVATLESVLAQSFRDFEIVVVNDGSPDDTAALVKPYVEDGRVLYVEQRNAGQSAARNRGIGCARGEFIALLDDDDLWPPDKLAWQVDALREDPSIGVVAGVAEFIDAEGRPLHVTPFVEELPFSSLFRHCPITSPGQTLIRRALLDEIGGLDETVAGVDDWDLWFKLAARSRFVMRRRIALRYRRHEGNASHQVGRLYAAARVVAARHADAIHDRGRREAALRAAFHGLHSDTGWGPLFARTLKSDVRQRRWESARTHWSYLASMWHGMGGIAMITAPLRDLEPDRVKALRRRLQRR
jgi:glycosyltransferase involved in cell wall biosynthesis